ncbi:MAG TPA: serine/threonine-protein kinase [Pyrinomonadaceae bacterium]|jgi:serine/threonine protein kinase
MSGLERFIGEVLDGKYRLERLLGQGGMGAVYLATHLGTERPVALKLITPEFMRNDEFVERFKREARAAGRLRHPNVVDVTDFGFAQVGAQRVAYLVMEYLDGCTLGDVLAEESSLPLDWVVDILEQVCSAVDEAHQQGVVHRDLKPDNIWLEPNRFGGYRVKVLDFGIAKLADAGAATTGDYGTGELNAPTDAGQPASRTDAQQQPQTPQSQLDLVQESIARAASSVGRGASAGGASAGGAPAANSARGGSSLDASTRRNPSNPSQSATAAAASQADSPEAATLLQLSNDVEAEPTETLLLAPPATRPQQEPPHDATAAGQTPRATLADADSDKTRLLEDATAGRRQPNELRTAAPSTAGVTRVGAILGTPLYMSPEQCRGRRLDARSDIYSLGVIAYQMLTGTTPFTGDMVSVMRQHMDTPPPNIREKNRKVKRKVARQVMSALKKNPAERPASASGFASALRGSAEGLGSLLTRAFALYSEHFPKFLRISLLAHLPVIAMSFLMYGLEVAQQAKVMSKWLILLLTIVFGLLNIVINFLSSSVITAMTALMVTQLHVAPMRPLSIHDALAVLKRRWRPFLRTSIRVSLTALVGFILLVIPGFIVMVRYALYAPVVLMEGLEKRAALKRANELSRRSRRTVIALLLIQLMLPVIIGAVISLLTFQTSGGELHIKTGSKALGHFAPLSNIIIVPLLAITSALLYLKMRQLGGETFKDTLEQFDNVEAPRTHWQQRMRRRLTMNNPTSRG